MRLWWLVGKPGGGCKRRRPAVAAVGGDFVCVCVAVVVYIIIYVFIYVCIYLFIYCKKISLGTNKNIHILCMFKVFPVRQP